MKHKWLAAAALLAGSVGVANAHTNLSIAVGVPVGPVYYQRYQPPVYRERVYYDRYYAPPPPVVYYAPPRPIYYAPPPRIDYRHDYYPRDHHHHDHYDRRDYDRGDYRNDRYDRRY